MKPQISNSEDINKSGIFPPGHYYSPIPNLQEVRQDETAIWGNFPRTIDGIDLNEDGQLRLFDKFKEFYKELPFPSEKAGTCRYYFENPSYSYSDAIILYCIIRHTKPRRIIEVGSGYSSCVTLDTSEQFFGDAIDVTFIEPYPDLLYSLIRTGDKEKVRVLPTRLQDVALTEFDSLENNDILFINSTHVSKVNSDVNYIFFKISPRLKRGVFIHFHDIFYPFEYPKEWIYEGRFWNEDYILHAFLQYNTAFKILFFNTFLEHFHEEAFNKYMPLCLRNRGGSIWLQKTSL